MSLTPEELAKKQELIEKLSAYTINTLEAGQLTSLLERERRDAETARNAAAIAAIAAILILLAAFIALNTERERG